MDQVEEIDSEMVRPSVPGLTPGEIRETVVRCPCGKEFVHRSGTRGGAPREPPKYCNWACYVSHKPPKAGKELTSRVERRWSLQDAVTRCQIGPDTRWLQLDVGHCGCGHEGWLYAPVEAPRHRFCGTCVDRVTTMAEATASPSQRKRAA